MVREPTPTQRLERLRERLQAAPRPAPAGGGSPDAKPAREQPAGGRSFCQWEQWGQFRQIQ